MICPERLKQVREARGFSQDELVGRMEHLISKAALSKYETGQAQPRPPVAQRLAQELRVDIQTLSTVPLVQTRFAFRHIAGVMDDRDQSDLQARLSFALEQRLELEKLLEINSGLHTFPPVTVRYFADAERAAVDLRQHLELGEDPIANVIDTLEGFGIHVFSWPRREGFDGLSVVMVDENDVRVSAGILLNPGASPERSRFTVSHELAHILLDIQKPLSIEKTCDHFAGAFLMPRKSLLREVGKSRPEIGFQELAYLRSYYGVSLQALVVRMYKLSIISKAKYDALFEELQNSPHWRLEEKQLNWRPEMPFRFLQKVEQAHSRDLLSNEAYAAFHTQESFPEPPFAPSVGDMAKIGRAASSSAREDLKSRGFAPVYMENGELVEEER